MGNPQHTHDHIRRRLLILSSLNIIESALALSANRTRRGISLCRVSYRSTRLRLMMTILTPTNLWRIISQPMVRLSTTKACTRIGQTLSWLASPTLLTCGEKPSLKAPQGRTKEFLFRHLNP